MYPKLKKLNELYGAHICGEGGEYETFTLDCPLFGKRIVLDGTETIVHSDDAFAPVCYWNLKTAHLEEKDNLCVPLAERMTPEIKRAILQSAKDAFEEEELVDLLESLDVSAKPQIEDTHQGPAFELVSTNESFTKEPKLPCVFKSDSLVALSGFRLRDPPATLSVEEEIKHIMDTMQDSLKENDLTWENVLLMHVYVSDMSLFGRMNAVYGSFFSINPPAR
jgi:diphthine-ammonia ligase